MIRCCQLWIALLSFVSMTMAQSLTTGAISGNVLDPSGAGIPKAVITATNIQTGARRTVISGDGGTYVIPQLDPGDYTVIAQSNGFKKTEIGPITVAVSRIASVAFRLSVGELTEKVEVSSQAPLIETSNPNTTTTFGAIQLADLPNPGNDLTYLISFVPGAIMNVVFPGTVAVGKVEFNGLGSVATNFTIDGLDANDPTSNVNATGATGLQLGLNAVQEMSVNTESYSVDQGRLGAAQVNYVTRSGTNAFRGNAYEVWNGAALNARNFFLNASPTPKRKPASNVNEFGASVGGPIVKNKLFFFTDFEGIRLVLPSVLTSTLPSPGYQAFVLQQLPLGGRDTVIGTNLPPQPGEVQFYKSLFSALRDSSVGTPLGVQGCPFDAGGGTPAIANNGNGCATQQILAVSPPANETLFTLKLDYNLGSRNAFWYRFQLDNGSRTSADVASPVFDAVTRSPQRSAAAGWTHTLNPNLVNQFNPGISYSGFLGDFVDPKRAIATFPVAYLSSFFSPLAFGLASNPFNFATTTWQLNDDLAWTLGKHSLKFGENFRRVLFRNPLNATVIPIVVACSLPEFTFGATCNTQQAFPKALADTFKGVSLDMYAQDVFKVSPKLTLTVGLRATWNSNPVSEKKLFTRLNGGGFAAISHDVNRPLNLDILSDQRHAFADTQRIQWQPRAAFAYELNSKTVVRAGFGVFSNVLPLATVSGLELNPPSSASFSGGLFGPAGGIAIAPGVPNSAVDAAVAANQRFQAGFAGGTLSCASPNASPSNCIPAFTFQALATSFQTYPYSLQWNSTIERQLGNSFRFALSYVGTRAVKSFYLDNPNGFQTLCSGCFAPIPFRVPADPRFGSFNSRNTGASSSYHALRLTTEKRLSRGLSFQLSYEYSHCLDSTSNGGQVFFNNPATNSIDFPGTLQNSKGNCDYDIRHSLKGWYLYELPFHSKHELLAQVVTGWQVSGTLFVRGGLPFTVLSRPLSGAFVFVTPKLRANSVAGQDPYTTASVSGVTLPGTIQWLNPNAFQSVTDTTTRSCFPTNSSQNCVQGNLGRNTLRAPGFAWMDFSLTKRFKITEKVMFFFDTQFYNLFNHPNFGFPTTLAGIPGKPGTLTGFGTINTTVSPSTGLLGSRLGGDSSVRMIALRGRIQF